MNKIILSVIIVLSCIFLLNSGSHYESNVNKKIGDKLDSLDGIIVYYNGKISHTGKRNCTSDGYNLGLKYQCVEFVKRYYYYHYKHKMPNVFGHAKDFYDNRVKDGKLNTSRNLIQFSNPSKTKPKKGDIIILSATKNNPYGHVAIVSKVFAHKIEIIQQNPGPSASSRQYFSLKKHGQKFKICSNRILGWLRKK